MSSNELDPHLIKCIGILYGSRHLRRGDSFPLQYAMEEALELKYGNSIEHKDYTDIFQSLLPLREIAETIATGIIYDDKEDDASVNDLELDLLKEDLMCVVCHKMNIGARNRLVECFNCHALYHQECHQPTVNEEDVSEKWICATCQPPNTKKVKTLEKEQIPKPASSSLVKPISTSSHKHSSSSSHKSSSEKHKSSKSSKSTSSSPSHGSSSRKQYFKTEDKKSMPVIKGSNSSKSSSSKYSERKKYE